MKRKKFKVFHCCGVISVAVKLPVHQHIVLTELFLNTSVYFFQKSGLKTGSEKFEVNEISQTLFIETKFHWLEDGGVAH